jgi:hypothetical protein
MSNSFVLYCYLFCDFPLFHINTYVVVMMKIYDGLLKTMINASFSEE